MARDGRSPWSGPLAQVVVPCCRSMWPGLWVENLPVLYACNDRVTGSRRTSKHSPPLPSRS